MLGLFLIDLLATLFMPRGVTRDRGSLTWMSSRHPRSTVRRARLLEGPWLTDPSQAMVEFVVADRRGLSFRVAYDHEELRVPADAIVELVDERDDGRHVRAASAGGAVLVEFLCPLDAGDVVADLRRALAG